MVAQDAQSTNVPPVARKDANNIDLMRLILAYYVVYSHCRILSGQSGSFPSIALPVDVAVQGFFILSGYLIFKSHNSTNNLKLYIQKRIRRIYPAYAAVVILSALGLYLVSDLPKVSYFGVEFWLYLISNLTFLNFIQPTLPGVFNTDTVMPTVNGSLWTLKIEVAFYLLVPILAIILRGKSHLFKGIFLVIIYISSHQYFQYFHFAGEGRYSHMWDVLAKQLPGQMRYFVLGVAVYYFNLEKTLILRMGALISVVMLLTLGARETDLLYPVFIGFIVMAVSFGSLPIDVRRIGDLSYGAYLIHFPVIQLFVSAGLFRHAPILGTILVFIVVSGLSFLSWRWIERPWIISKLNVKKY